MPTLTSGTRTSTTEARFTTAIIGAGFSGAILATHLLRQADGGHSIALIGPDALLGRGVAYSTQCPGHFLNVPAGAMSAFADDPDHFVKWARLNYDSGVEVRDFLPRPLYGQYVGSLLLDEYGRHPHQLEWLRDDAVSICPDGPTARVTLRNGRRLNAENVVLALGNFASADPPMPGRTRASRRYFSRAWSNDALEGVAAEESILLIGSGLTSVDIAIALREREFEGTIHILSRHGLLPQKHAYSVPWHESEQRLPATARALTRFIRSRAEIGSAQGSDWRAVIDSLRPYTHAIWKGLPSEEKRRFLRHLRPYWDVHRHRVAPTVDSILSSQLENGRIQAHRGRIEKYREDTDGVEIAYRERSSGKQNQLRVDRVINCTGPEGDCRKVNNPVVQDLLRRKLVRPDSLLLGLDTADNGALIDAGGRPSDFLYTVGPARRGSLWETIAVPEIRDQIAELTSVLVSRPQLLADLSRWVSGPSDFKGRRDQYAQ